MEMNSITTMSKEDYYFIRNNLELFWGERAHIFVPLHHPMFYYSFGNTAYTITEKGSVAAYLLGFFSQREDAAYVHMINVRMEYQGRGYGRKLYEHFISIAQKKGCTSIGAITSVKNSSSIAFHKSLGMSLTGDGMIDGIPVELDYAGEGEHRVLFSMAI